MKIKRINKSKFLRNILVSVFALLVVAFIINIAPGYRRDKYTDVINLIINEENKTEDLKNSIYINENGTVYMSEEDVRNLFDSTIYYDNKYNELITTSRTKVASISIDENKININNSIVSMLEPIIKIDNNIYLPISDMSIVYNIKIEYIQEARRVIIDDLSKGMIRATVADKTDIKFRPRKLSKNIGTVNTGETVNCFYTTSKGWRQIRTSDGTIGYIKANKLSDEYIIRQDMPERKEAVKISYADYESKKFEVLNSSDTKEQVVLKNVLNINGDIIESIQDTDIDFETYKTWISVSNKDLEERAEEILQDYKSRTELTNKIVSKIVEDEAKGVCIDLSNVQNKESMIRFTVELAPKLRELGIATCIVLHDNMNKQDYINIVDYIVE